MKIRLFSLLLAMALLLGGCQLVPDQYASVVPHDDSYSQSEEEITVNNYTELKDAVDDLIHAGIEEATLTTDVYSSDLEKDFALLTDFITNEDPDLAYVVSSIDREIVHVGSYNKIDLKIHYRHSYEESQVIEGARNMDIVRASVVDALEKSQEVLLLKVINYVDTDFEKMAKEYAEKHLTEVIAAPSTVLKKTFPKTGGDRILELRFIYPCDEKDLSARKQVVDYMIESAVDSVKNAQTDLDQARLLYSSQIGGHSYSEESTSTPAFDLFSNRKGNSAAFSAVYSAMCDKANVNCIIVHGKKNGEDYDWNILDLESGVWHVDVNADAQSGSPELRLLTDAEMEGYEWDTRVYPACVGLYEPAVTTQDQADQSERPPEQSEEQTPETPAEPETTPDTPEKPEEPEITP